MRLVDELLAAERRAPPARPGPDRGRPPGAPRGDPRPGARSSTGTAARAGWRSSGRPAAASRCSPRRRPGGSPGRATGPCSSASTSASPPTLIRELEGTRGARRARSSRPSTGSASGSAATRARSGPAAGPDPAATGGTRRCPAPWQAAIDALPGSSRSTRSSSTRARTSSSAGSDPRAAARRHRPRTSCGSSTTPARRVIRDDVVARARARAARALREPAATRPRSPTSPGASTAAASRSRPTAPATTARATGSRPPSPGRPTLDALRRELHRLVVDERVAPFRIAVLSGVTASESLVWRQRTFGNEVLVNEAIDDDGRSKGLAPEDLPDENSRRPLRDDPPLQGARARRRDPRGAVGGAASGWTSCSTSG